MGGCLAPQQQMQHPPASSTRSCENRPLYMLNILHAGQPSHSASHPAACSEPRKVLRKANTRRIAGVWIYAAG